MSPRLTFVQGPGITTLASSAVPQPCLFQGASCYGPYDLGKVYNFPSNLDGSGQTIIIVDAYGSPRIAADLAAFDRYFRVPAPRSSKIINAAGTGATGSGALTGWQVETSLDVEYAHAMAPGANIVLAVAATDNNFDINAAEAQVFPLYPGAIVSQSFGDWETDVTAGTSFAAEHKIFQAATRLGDTVLASAGDAGATWTQYTGTASPALASYPASDPLVTGVGGTQGNPYPGGLEAAGPTAERRRGTSRNSTRRRAGLRASCFGRLPGNGGSPATEHGPYPMSPMTLRSTAASRFSRRRTSTWLVAPVSDRLSGPRSLPL